ncbi:flagellar hook capping protein [Nocardioides jishulii]|uniref:Flagellar hook capping protein n=1 Tax=Nocardioides jishulii TaxID=2575440 RepID=A0A4U2YVZ9_9ACTN|nr:flagellar hook capping protein [Nocardioides jishulii]TKI64932.1 flagellar hook capping protein [Nocardioides jishulii]
MTPGLFGTGATATQTTQDKDMFLQLLVTQMRYQDPLNPTDSSQFLAQTAQFTSLEKMQAVADQTALLLASQMAFGASGLVGRHVTYTDADGKVQKGTVSGVTFGASGPVLDIDGAEVPLGSIVSVTDGTATPDATTDSD